MIELAGEKPEKEPEEPEEEAPAEKQEKKKKKEFTDMAFGDAVGKAVTKHLKVVERAREFLPATYSFTESIIMN